MSNAPTVETLEVETGDRPTASLIVLHGLGADGHDFEPLAQQMDLSALGPVRWIFPHAPVRPVTINGGYRMRAWYDLLGSELQRREDEPGLRASLQEVLALVARERERGVAARRILLAGFSQGCAMALLAALRCEERLAGVAGLSGYLPLASLTAAERHGANADLPVFLAHGSMDPVVPMAAGSGTRELLRQLGHEVEWHEYPIGHTVSVEELEALRTWILKTAAA
ncbi:alpha/beta hydrolase [Azohydromonas lata]|uniref:Dienelactone hydrolase family protein n=1 Tax=Azohydromonas lata TaxID=45677 RepID=A0ABU5IBC4_9BURK|nr:dienelactone hydrolase family protein [Azohydromonas lata]MDZ5456391.1 dienelactone hydrolase family protein [Azohydromonas lata]